MAALLAVALTLAGCKSARDDTAAAAAGGSPHSSVSDFPDEIGRGFPGVRTGKDSARNVDLTSGAEAPDFELVLDDGQSIRLSDLRGNPVMINFWATWCPPCRAEMPDIVAAAGEEEDLIVIAANVQETVEAIRPFAEAYAMQMPVAVDEEGSLSNLFQVRGMPTSIFIDRDGKIASKWEGALTPEQLDLHLDGIR
jgi:peroxiredoxin